MSDEKFRVKYGLAVGNTVATIDSTSGDITTDGDVYVNGGDIRTSASVASVFPVTPTTVSIATGATTVSIGANTGTTTINNSLVADDISILTVDTTNLEVTNIKAKDGTAAMTIADSTGAVNVSSSLQVDNIDIRINTISATDTNGSINLTPNGTGAVRANNSLDVGTIRALDGTAAATIADTTGIITVSSQLNVDNLNLSGNTLSSTNTNGNITLTPDGTGVVTVSSDLAVNGATSADITTTTTTATVFNTNATTVNIAGAGTTVSIGANTGTTTINNSLVADDISVTTVDTTNLEVTNIKAKDGTAAAIIADSTGIITVSTELNVDNLNLSGNTLSSTNANGNITLTPNGTGVVTVSSDLAVNGGDITTTQTTGTLYNTTATTVSIGGAATTTNIGPSTVGSSIVNGANRLTSPTIFNFVGANNYRGLLVSNLTSGAYATARNGIVMRTVPTTSIGPRGGIVFENARSNSSGVLAALQGPSTTQVGDYLGEIISGGYATDRYVTEAVAAAPLGFTPYATETWVNSGTTVSNAGTGWALQLQPTATNLSSTSRVTTIDSTPQNLSLRSDLVGVSKGKTTQFIATGCSTNGTTLTIGTLTSGSITVGTMIQNSTNLLPAGTYIVANISGSGSGSQWTLNQTQPTYTSSLTLAGNQGYMSMTGSGDVDVMGKLTVRATPGATLPINYTRVYGQWQYNAVINGLTANTAYVFPLGSADFSSIATVASTSQLIPGAVGKFNFQFSLQCANTSSNSYDVYIWLKKDGADVTGSMGRITVPGSHAGVDGKTISSWNYILDATATGSYFELAYAVEDSSVYFTNYSSTAFGPSTATLITTLTPVGA